MNWPSAIRPDNPFWREGRTLPVVLARFYAVGLLLYIVPWTRELFVHLIAPSLVLVIALVLALHRPWNAKTIGWTAFVALTSFFVEMRGVNAGDLFGSYRYGPGLGWKINGTPLLIGLNWVFLSYASHDIATRWSNRPWVRVLTASLLMLAYDTAMEWVAPDMRMWNFAGEGFPPWENFRTWFLLALVYTAGLEAFGISSDNRTARLLFGLQILFFLVIGTYSALFL